MPGRKIQKVRTKGVLKKNITPFFVPVFCRCINVDTSFYKYIAGKNSYAGEYDWADASMVLLDPQGDEVNGAGINVNLELAYRLLLTLNNFNSVNLSNTLSNQSSLEKTISKIAENHISRLYSTNASNYFELRGLLKEIKELETLKQLPARKLTKKLRGQIDVRSENVKSIILKQLSVLGKETDYSILKNSDTSGKKNDSPVMRAGFSRIISLHNNQRNYIDKANTVYKPNILNTVLHNNPLVYEEISKRTVLNISGVDTEKTNKQIHSLAERIKKPQAIEQRRLIRDFQHSLTYTASGKKSNQPAPNILQLYGYNTEFINLIEKTTRYGYNTEFIGLIENTAQVIKENQTAGTSEKMGLSWLQLIEDSTSNIFKQQVNSSTEVQKQEIEKYHESVIKEELRQRNYKDTVLRSVNERIGKFITIERGIPEVRIPVFRQTNIIQLLHETGGISVSAQATATELIENTVYETNEYTQMVLKQDSEYEKRVSEEELVNYIERQKASIGKNAIFHSIMDRLERFMTVYTIKAANNLMVCEVKKTTELYKASNAENSTVFDFGHNEFVNLESPTVLDKRVNNAFHKTWGNNMFQSISEYFAKKISVHKGVSEINPTKKNVFEENIGVNRVLRENFWRNFSKNTEIVKNERSTILQSFSKRIEGYERLTELNGSADNQKASAVQSKIINQASKENSSEVVFNSYSDTILSPVKFNINYRKEESFVRKIIEKKTSGFIKKIYKGTGPVLHSIINKFSDTRLQQSIWNISSDKKNTPDTYIENNSELTFYNESNRTEALNKTIENSIKETIRDKVATAESFGIRTKEQSRIALFERVLEKNALWLLKNLSSSAKSVKKFFNIQEGREYLEPERNIVNLRENRINAEIAHYRQNNGDQLINEIKNTVNGQGGSNMAITSYITRFSSTIASKTINKLIKNSFLSKSISNLNKLESNSYSFVKNEVVNNEELAFVPDRKSMADKSLKTVEGTITNVFKRNIFEEIINRNQLTEMIHSRAAKNETEYSKGFAAGADIEYVKKVSHKNDEKLELQEKTIKGLTQKLEVQTELVKNLCEKQNIKTEKPVDIRDITNNVMRQLQKELRLERQRRGME